MVKQQKLVLEQQFSYKKTQPTRLFKQFLWYFTIESGAKVIGILDALAFVGVFLHLGLHFANILIEFLSFFSGSYFFTILPSFLLVKFPRLVALVIVKFEKNGKNAYRVRDLYWRIRLITMVI